MPQFLDKLPPHLEDAETLIKRRDKAAERKELWRSHYAECFRYAMPMRETFYWEAPGQQRVQLYDSTLQESTYTAANTMVALLFPGWKRWVELAPGGAFPKELVDKRVIEGLQAATETFFDYLNHSNFNTVIHEVALDLMVGTGAMRFDEGEDDDNPFVFSSTPLPAIELEEGPNGTVETVWMCRKPAARNIARMYPGLEEFDLPHGLQEKIAKTPDEKIEIVQGTVYDPVTKRYYGLVIWKEGKVVIWRYDYGNSSPDIVARAFSVTGEIYGRGRVMLALDDARTLDKMQQFILEHAALQIAPPMTAVTDGVLNPHTAVLSPRAVMPVASNDQRNPSLRAVEVGGDFVIGETRMTDLREKIRRIMLGPEPSDGPVKSATEISISDRNRMWAMNGDYLRIQSELLAKIVSRGVSILQSRGIVPQFKVDGREVTVKFTSPFARSQDSEDLLALERTMNLLAPFEGAAQIGLDIDGLTEWVSQKAGLDQKLVNDEGERRRLKKEAADAAAQMGAAMQEQGQLPTQ